MESDQKHVSIDFEKIRKLSEVISWKPPSFCEHSIICLGNTGVGKSAFLSLVCEQPLIRKKLGIMVFYDNNEKNGQTPCFKIGCSMKSETSIPNHFYDENKKIFYWDCPGFLDNNGLEQEIRNFFYITQIFKYSRNVKLLILARGRF